MTDYTTSNNTITLTRTKHEPQNLGRCYYNWTGEYQILSSRNPVTNEDIQELKDKHIFGCGQIVNAALDGDIIKYSGVCDSGD
jgi:hypothetical protein